MNGGNDGFGANVDVGDGGVGGGLWADMNVGADGMAIERSTIHKHLTLFAGAGIENSRVANSSVRVPGPNQINMTLRARHAAHRLFSC